MSALSANIITAMRQPGNAHHPPKVQVRRFSPEIMKALKQASDEVLNEAAARDPFTKSL